MKNICHLCHSINSIGCLHVLYRAAINNSFSIDKTNQKNPSRDQGQRGYKPKLPRLKKPGWNGVLRHALFREGAAVNRTTVVRLYLALGDLSTWGPLIHFVKLFWTLRRIFLELGRHWASFFHSSSSCGSSPDHVDRGRSQLTWCIADVSLYFNSKETSP